MATTINRDFAIEHSDRSPGLNRLQLLGSRLWLPMLGMAIAGFAVGIVLAIVRADEVSTRGLTETAESLRHVSAGFMFIGFLSVFGAISFAIARILGAFRSGGGDVQEAVGGRVETLMMPLTARVFMGGMMTAMMLLVVTVVLHFVFAANVSDAGLNEERFLVLEGLRRLGIAIYLVSIAFGLATIIRVLRFQTIRIRELATGRH